MYKKFYKELGKLLFAMAKVDGTIHPKEVAAMKEMVRTELAPFEDTKDDFGTDAAYFAEFEFDFLANGVHTVDEAYSSFESYIKEYDKKLPVELKKLAYRLSYGVANASHGINKKEQALLDKIEDLLGVVNEEI